MPISVATYLSGTPPSSAAPPTTTWHDLPNVPSLLRSCTLTVNITEGLRPSYPSGWKDFTDLQKLESKSKQKYRYASAHRFEATEVSCSPNHPICRVKNFERQVGPMGPMGICGTPQGDQEFGHEDIGMGPKPGLLTEIAGLLWISSPQKPPSRTPIKPTCFMVNSTKNSM